MNTHKIPFITINKLNSLCKKFLWNANTNSTKKSPISWQNLSYHKNYGGLSIRNLYILNKAFILKNAWRLHTEKNSLWSRTIRGKYFPQKNILNAPTPKSYNSRTWKNIFHVAQMLRDTCFWILGNGKKNKFLER